MKPGPESLSHLVPHAEANCTLTAPINPQPPSTHRTHFQLPPQATGIQNHTISFLNLNQDYVQLWEGTFLLLLHFRRRKRW